MSNISLPCWKCDRCDHIWLPRKTATPKVCPKCKSPYWNTPRGAAQLPIPKKEQAKPPTMIDYLTKDAFEQQMASQRRQHALCPRCTRLGTPACADCRKAAGLEA